MGGPQKSPPCKRGGEATSFQPNAPKHQPAPQKESTKREHQTSHRSNLRCSAGPKPILPAHIEEALKLRGRGHLPVPISALGMFCLSFGQDARTTRKTPTPPAAVQPSHPLPHIPCELPNRGEVGAAAGLGEEPRTPSHPASPPISTQRHGTASPGPTQDTRHDGTTLPAPPRATGARELQPRAPQSVPALRLPSTGDVFSLLQTLCTPP